MAAISQPAKEAKKKFRTLHLRDFVIAFSFANLCYLRIWYGLEATPNFGERVYLSLKTLPGPPAFLAAMLNVTLLAIALLVVIATFRRYLEPVGPVGRALFVSTLALPLLIQYSAKLQQLRWTAVRAVGPTILALAVGAALLIVAGAIFRWHAELARWGAILLIAFAPAIPLTFAKAAWDMSHCKTMPYPDLPSPPPSPTARRSPRVVWVIFDEWDYRLSFPDRSRELKLPEVDRLLQTALSTTDAIPPARDTVKSVPMLLSGERYADNARFPDPWTVEVSPLDEPDRSYNWKTRSLIFSEAQALHFNTAATGWHLPYCRVLADELNACYWVAGPNMRDAPRSDTVRHAMIDQARSMVETRLWSPFGASLLRQGQAADFRAVYEHALEYITDPTYGLVFVHVPVPHAPFIYDRRTQTLLPAHSTYDDNLALLDRTLGEFRRAMEAAGLWDTSTVLFSTDHYLRNAYDIDGKMDFRIPFILKLAGQKTPAQYTRRVNTVVTKSLLMAVLRGEITEPQAAMRWLEGHGTAARTIGINSPVE
jgi:hypothetical protein